MIELATGTFMKNKYGGHRLNLSKKTCSSSTLAIIPFQGKLVNHLHEQ